MVLILAIDAAWKDTEPSGVALVSKNDNGIWICRTVVASEAFFRSL